MAGQRVDLYVPAVRNGGVWEVIFKGLADTVFTNGFGLEIYRDPQKRIAIPTMEFFVTKEAGGTSALQMRFGYDNNPAPPTVHLGSPAA